MPTPRWLTAAELRTRWGNARVDGLADRDGNGVPDTGRVETAIVEAESRVESRLLTRYRPGDLPTTTGTASAALKRIVGGLALYVLAEHLTRPADDVLRAKDDAMSELKDLVQGQAVLALADEPAVDDSRPTILTTKSSRGTFALENLDF